MTMVVAAVADARAQIPPKTGGFTMNLRTGGIPAAYRDSEYMVWLQDMKRFFERIITSNRTLNVDVGFRSLDGNILAQAGPGNGGWNPLDYMSAIDTYSDNTARPNQATMDFNTAYYKQPPVTETDRGWKRQFFTTALHEAFHAVGLGSLWNGPFRVLMHIPNPIPDWLPGGGGGINITLSDGLAGLAFGYNKIGIGDPNNPRYTASHALSQYRSQMSGQSGVGNIPIENTKDGINVISWTTTMTQAGGTALAHWKGNVYGTASGIVNERGQDRVDEVFTSWSSRDEGRRRWIGRYTIGALRDIGYSVDYTPLRIALNDWKSV